MMNEIIRARKALTPFIKPGSVTSGRSPYHFKRHAIEHCLYGVDIDPGAIEIAKLRLWLSLIVDEEDRDKVQPLPNLDYKIICGDSLLGINKNDGTDGGPGTGTTDAFYEHSLKELHKKKQLYFNESLASKKQKYKKEIDQVIDKVTEGKKLFDFGIYFSEVFQENKGFDVVIANPPYVSHDAIQNKKYFKKNYKAYDSFADLYCYFLEIALNIQNKTGILCYITSNSYLRADYGKPLRDLLLEKNYILNIVNIEEFQLFSSAIVNTTILISKRKDEKNPKKCCIVNSKYKKGITFEKFINQNKFFYSQNQFQDRSWYLLKPELLSIKKKIEQIGKTLEIYNTKIRLGIATGANSVFVIDEKRKNELINRDKKNRNIIKPVLKGKNIFRFKYQFKNQYLILSKNGIDIKKDYPVIYNYFDSFGDSFKKRGAQGENWFNLRATAFLDDFKKEKIIWIELTNNNRFALCSEEIYLLNSAYFLIPPKELSSKYLLALLNSNLIKFYLSLIAETSGMGITRWINNYIKTFPIPSKSAKEQKPFINFVNKILEITKTEDYLQNARKKTQVQKYEKQIDQLVYKLYALTSQEIKIIEKNI